jgi:hypothetical protein
MEVHVEVNVVVNVAEGLVDLAKVNRLLQVFGMSKVGILILTLTIIMLDLNVLIYLILI